MAFKIKLRYGDYCGNNEVKYLGENISKKPRQAFFECPQCHTVFSARPTDVKTGRIQSCGCYHRSSASNRRKLNLEDQVFGHLHVISFIEINKNGKSIWECKCDCGVLTQKIGSDLINGKVTTCGRKECCFFRQKHAECRKKDITGQKFGKLLAISNTNKTNNGNSYIWKCKCDCGNLCYIPLNQLVSGQTKSCGCVLSF